MPNPTVQPKYGTTAAVNFASGLNGLANNASYQSAAIDNTTALAGDYILDGNFKTASGTLGTNPGINIFISASFDGTNFGGAYGANTIGGGVGAFTLPSITSDLGSLKFKQIIASAEVEYFNGLSVAQLFGGIMPLKFVVVVNNVTGLALDATAGGTINYTPMNFIIPTV